LRTQFLSVLKKEGCRELRVGSGSENEHEAKQQQQQQQN